MNEKYNNLKDFCEYLQELNLLSPKEDINVLLNNYNKKYEFYSDNFIKAVKELHNFYNDKIIFCGSLGLVINHCLNRKIHDIDALLLKNEFIYTPPQDILGSSSPTFEIDGTPIEVKKIKLRDVDIDLFHIKSITDI